MKISKKIEGIISLNIIIWHEATKIKTTDNFSRLGLSLEDKGKIFLKIREYNNKRSLVRFEIDKFFNSGTNETKVF
jgi:hypothetical protein